MRYRVVAQRRRGEKWESKWHWDLPTAVAQATRWREKHELLSLAVQDENGKEHPIPRNVQ